MTIKLINMPFANLAMPSLGLTQLASVLKTRFHDSVEVDIVYLSLEFARYFGDHRFYSHALADAGFMTGVGDWFFRQSAFPEAPDNTDAYFARFYFEEDDATRELRRVLREKRKGLDAFLDELIDEYDLASADIVGFTALFSQTVGSFAMARRLKLATPGIITCIGGAACEGGMGREFARHVDAIDYVFSGPGLKSFPAFVDHIQRGEREACEGIRGVLSRDNADDAGEGMELLGDALDVNANVPLDYAPFLDAFDRALPCREVRPVLLFETSRGCYWAEKTVCTFCGLNGLQRCYRQMTPENALVLLRSLQQWAPRCPSFIAVDTAMPRNYVAELFPKLETESGMKIMYEVRTDLGEAELAAMVDGGVAALQPGIEALSTASLKRMRKGCSAFRNIRFLKACSRLPLSLDWNLLIYSPGEAEEVYAKYMRDIPLLPHLAPPTGVYPIMFVRHSCYFDEPEAFGLDLLPQDFYALTYPFEEGTLRRIANHFVDRNADSDGMDDWLEMLNCAVVHWRERWLGSDGKPQARLCYFEDGTATSVYDSRSGDEVVHSLTAGAGRVLKALEVPLRQHDLSRLLSDLPSGGIEEDITFLLERGLLFEENGRYLSLVT